MSGIIVFSVTYFLFSSTQAQKLFFALCTLCFCIIVTYRLIDFFRQVSEHKVTTLLFSSNPISAGSLLILLSTGPLILFEQARTRKEKLLLITWLLLGILVLIIIGKRGPILALGFAPKLVEIRT